MSDKPEKQFIVRWTWEKFNAFSGLIDVHKQVYRGSYEDCEIMAKAHNGTIEEDKPTSNRGEIK